MTIAKGQPILASDIIAVVDRVTATETAVAGKQQNLPVGTILMYDGSSGWTDNSTMPGWYQCNGQKVGSVNLPDLRDKFIRGWSAASAVKSEGGRNSQSVGLIEANIPSHSHSLKNENISVTGGSHNHSFKSESISIPGGGSHTHGVTDNGHTHSIWLSHLESKDQNTPSQSNDGEQSGPATTQSAKTGISVNSTGSSHTHAFNLSGKSTADNTSHSHTLNLNGKSTDPTGSGTAFTIDTVPVYYTLMYIRKCT